MEVGKKGIIKNALCRRRRHIYSLENKKMSC